MAVLSHPGMAVRIEGHLAAENVVLRHQVLVLWRKVRWRVRLTDVDRLFLVQLYRWFP